VDASASTLAAPPAAELSAAVWDDPLEQARFTRREAAADGEIAESVLLIDGIYCAACAPTIEAALRRVGAVVDVEVNAATRRARVRWRPESTRLSQLTEAIAAAGYRARPALAAGAEATRRREQRAALWRLFVAGFCMMQVMMYATPAYVAAPGEIPADLDALLRWASWLLTIPVVLFCAQPWFGAAWAHLRARRIGMDVPIALGIAVTFVASSGATFSPGGVFGNEVYFDSLAMFVFFLLGGRWLELRARSATLGALDALTQRVPEQVERLLDGERVETVPAARLRAGDRVRVRPGQAFPADGHLEASCVTQVDEALLTGESMPLSRSAGDAVLAGSVNLSSPVVMRVQRAGHDTRYAQIVALIERAAFERPALARAADRVAQPFLWAVLLLAAGAAAVWALIDPSRSLWVAVSVLVVTCPCALSLATPSALITAAGTLARRGVLLQRLGALEALAQAQVFAFDKTGTLTQDRLAFADIELIGARTHADVMREALALAQASLHPAARALSQAWPDVSPAPMHALIEHPGQGVEGLDASGRRWRLGAADFVGARPWQPSARSASWLSCDGRVLARFGFDEVLRVDAQAALAALRADGASTWLLSGDRSDAAARVARALQIDRVHAGASPEDKLAAVAALQAQGRRVAMVGDGINDAPVLARADVSVAMGHGAALARQQADLTLLSGRLSDLVVARELAQRTLRVVRQNLIWAALYNAACVPFALAGWLPPWAAGLGMAASSLLVVLNAQRLRRV
jgi:Cu2+-exporting ATPase